MHVSIIGEFTPYFTANNPWDYDLGDYITVTAKDSAGTALASNVVGGKPVPDFNFTYHAK